MAFGHGSKAVFKIQDSGGVSRDISAYIRSASLPRSIDTAETTVLGLTAKTYIPGLHDATISIEGIWDPTVDGYLDGIAGFATARTWEYHPQGTASGTIKYSGSCIETSYETSDPVDDVGTFTAEFQVTGVVTRATNP